MNYKINYLNNINIDTPYDLIFFRLGYKKNKTNLLYKERKKIVEIIDYGVKLCKTKIAYKFCELKNKKDNELIIDSSFSIKSKNLYSLLNNCSLAILMAATVGKKILQKRDSEINKGNAIFSLILDATASEIADGLLDWLENYLKFQLLRENAFLTKRFSPGYGDVDLLIQKKIYKHLKLKKIGININKKNILIPEKSVIAISGIKIYKG